MIIFPMSHVHADLGHGGLVVYTPTVIGERSVASLRTDQDRPEAEALNIKQDA